MSRLQSCAARRALCRAAVARPVALAVMALMSAVASAQSTDAVAAESGRIEVVAPTPVPGLGTPRDRVAAPVQVLRGEALSRDGGDELTSALTRRLGSVHVNDLQGNPAQAELSFRGFGASPLLGAAQGLSVYLNGVRLNQPFGDVVSWDLIPRTAIGSVTLMPGANPLFGLNTLGGALSLQTKDGRRNPGTVLEVVAGEHRRATLSFEHGGHREDGTHWYVTGQRHHDDGWRDASPSDTGQVFGKLGWRSARSDWALSGALADNTLYGNGLQEQRMLAADRTSIYTQPDRSLNRGLLLNLSGRHDIGDDWTLDTQLHHRRLRTRSLNGDVNEDALDQSLYQPSANERNALAGAGYSGYPVSGESAANTPFPKWRCIANALLRDEPGEKCTGLLTRASTEQHETGLNLQLGTEGTLAGRPHQLTLGAALSSAHVRYGQMGELGYLNADRSVTGVGAFGDGVTGGDIDGEPYDTQVSIRSRSRTASLLASDTLALARGVHLTLSGRYDRQTVHTRDRVTPGGGSGSLDGDHRFSRFNPAIGLTAALSPAVTVYGGVNQGSRAPSAIELGCADPAHPCKMPNAMASDPPLRQVVATNVEAGARGRQGSWVWNVGLFRTDSRDDILFVADDTAGYGYFKNFGRTRRQGLEAGTATRVGPLGLSLQYTLLEATYRTTEVVDGSSNSSNSEADEGRPGVDGAITVHKGDRMPLIPRQMLKLGADWSVNPTLALDLDVTAVGGALARGNENGEHQADGTYYLGSGRSAGYAVANLGLNFKPASVPGLSLFLHVSNLFDRQYHTAAQLGATAFDAQGKAVVARPFPANAEGERPLIHSTFYAPGAPRTVWAGLRWAFDR